MAQLVSDEVWRQLDPYAGQLPRRTVWRLRAIVLGAAALIVGVTAIWWSGAIVPRISWPIYSGSGYGVGPEQIEYQVNLNNDGHVPATVLAVGRSGPGFELIEVRGAFPTTLGPGEEMTVVLVYRVTDCAAVPADPWPVPVVVDRPWGRYTSQVPLPPLTGRNAPTGSRSYTGRDPFAVEWQREVADESCAARH